MSCNQQRGENISHESSLCQLKNKLYWIIHICSATLHSGQRTWDSNQAHALTQLWQRVHGRAALVTCEKPDGFSLALRAFYKALALAPSGTCTVMFTQMSLMYHPSLFPPLSHHFSLLRCLSSVAIHPCDYLFLFRCFPSFIPSSPSPSAFLALIKPSSAPEGWIVSLMDGRMEH